jgi:hypothetical protein
LTISCGVFPQISTSLPAVNFPTKVKKNIYIAAPAPGSKKLSGSYHSTYLGQNSILKT